MAGMTNPLVAEAMVMSLDGGRFWVLIGWTGLVVALGGGAPSPLPSWLDWGGSRSLSSPSGCQVRKSVSRLCEGLPTWAPDMCKSLKH
jgi:hypothetical protein